MTYSLAVANASSIIMSVLSLFGIEQAPTTALELVWDVFIIIIGLFMVKYVMIFIISFIREALKLGRM